jgi:hypothetical protein
MQTDGFLKFAALRPDKQPNAAPSEYLTIRDAWRRMSLKTAAPQKGEQARKQSGCYSRVKERS